MEASGQKRWRWRRRQAAEVVAEAGGGGGAQVEYVFGWRRRVRGRAGCERSKQGKWLKGERCGGAGVGGLRRLT